MGSVTILHCDSSSARNILKFAETEELLKEGCRHLLCEESNGIKINVKQTAFDLPLFYLVGHTLFSTT